MPTKLYAYATNENDPAKTLVRGLRQPQSGETVARQIYEAARVVGMHRSETDLRMVRRCWYGQCRIGTLIERLAASDPDFHQHTIAALTDVLRQRKGGQDE